MESISYNIWCEKCREKKGSIQGRDWHTWMDTQEGWSTWTTPNSQQGREGVKQKIGELEAQRRTSQQQDDNPLQQVGQSKPLHQLALLHGGGGHEQLIHHFWSKGQNNKTQDHEVHARRLPD